MENKKNINRAYTSFYLIAFLFLLFQILSIYYLSKIFLFFLILTLYLVYDVSSDIKEFHGWVNRKPTYYILILINIILPLIGWLAGFGRGIGKIRYIGNVNNLFLIPIIFAFFILIMYTLYITWIYPKEFRSIYRILKIYRNTFLYPKSIDSKRVLRCIKERRIGTNAEGIIKTKKVKSLFSKGEYTVIFISPLKAVIDIRSEGIYVKLPRVGKKEKELMRSLGEL